MKNKQREEESILRLRCDVLRAKLLLNHMNMKKKQTGRTTHFLVNVLPEAGLLWNAMRQRNKKTSKIRKLLIPALLLHRIKK